MQGKYDITISNVNVSFTITLERNITIIRGDSATGKQPLSIFCETLNSMVKAVVFLSKVKSRAAFSPMSIGSIG